MEHYKARAGSLTIHSATGDSVRMPLRGNIIWDTRDMPMPLEGPDWENIDEAREAVECAMMESLARLEMEVRCAIYTPAVARPGTQDGQTMDCPKCQDGLLMLSRMDGKWLACPLCGFEKA